MRTSLRSLASFAVTIAFFIRVGFLPIPVSAADIPAEHQDIIDPAQFSEAELVIRVYVSSAGEGSKYWWVPVINHSTIKSPKPVPSDVGASMRVACLSSGPGLPTGFATLYLVRYNPDHPEYGWKLLERPATQTTPALLGYSHHSVTTTR
jgi:hypothetical protein